MIWDPVFTCVTSKQATTRQQNQQNRKGNLLLPLVKMRYSIVFTGALATAASASPAFFKRYYVTEYAYVTDVVTVTAGNQAASTPAPTEVSVAAVPSSSAGWKNWFGNGNGWSSSSQAPAPPPPTTTAPPPPPPTTQAPPPPKPTTTQKAATPSKASSGGGAPAYSDIVVMHHNLHRANHSAPDIEWDEDLANTALAIAQSCQYEHNV